MKRPFANTFCLMLVLASYLWGGCVSCQELFAADQAADCCDHRECDRMAHESSQTHQPPHHQHSQACAQQSWMQTPAPDASIQLAQHYASLPVVVLTADAIHDADQLNGNLHHAPELPGASPPDLPVLHAALLI